MRNKETYNAFLQANGDVIFWERNTKSYLRALYSVEKNTVTPLFPIDSEKVSLQFIDEYGFHYFGDKVLDINGNYVAPFNGLFLIQKRNGQMAVLKY